MAPTTYFALGAALMWLGTLAFLYLRTTVSANERYYDVVTAVGATAAICYTAMALDVGSVMVNGQEVYAARYVQWVVGTPLIVAYLGWLAGVGRTRLWTLVAVDVAAMLTTPVLVAVDPPLQWGVFAVGVALYLVLMYYLLGALGSAADDQPAPVRELFRKLRNLTVVVWTFYPVVWLVGPFGFGLVDPTAEVLLITYLDVIAKIVFGFIAFNSRRAVDQLPDLNALRGWTA